MAGFGGLFALSERSGCLGVERGKNEEEVICSFANGAIEVYNVHDQSCVHSWSLQSSDQLTCPALYHRPSGRYCAVRNSQELLSWLEDSEKIDGTPQALPSSSAHFLLAPSTNHCLVVVFSEGRAGLVDVRAEGGGSGPLHDVAIVGRITRSSSPTLLHSALCWYRGWEYMTVVFTHGGLSYVSVCSLGKGGLGEAVSSQLEGGGGAELSACCVCGSNLITLWSDSSLICYRLSSFFSRSTHPPSPVLDWRAPLPSPPLTTHTHTLASISEEYFVLGACKREGGGGGRVTLWESTYSTCQATTEIGGKYSKLYCVGGFLYAVGGDGVHVCSVEGGGGGLAAALGRKKEARSRDSQLVIPTWMKPGTDCRSWERELSQKEGKARQFISDLTDPSVTATLQAFTTVFDARPLSADVSYCSVAERLLSEESFWAREPLIRLLRENLFPLSLSGELCEASLERKDWSLITVALRYIDQVPESTLVRLVQQTLSLPEEMESYGVTVGRDQLMFQLLTLPKNYSLLQQPLSELPFAVVLSLLRFLHHHMDMRGLLTLSSVPTSAPDLVDPRSLSYHAVVEWVGLLLDVHFTQLALSSEAKDILKSLRSNVVMQVRFLTEISPLHGLVEVWKSKEVIGAEVYGRSKTDWRYRIDRINVDI